MIINNFEPIELKNARTLVENMVIEQEVEEVYFNDSLGRVLSSDIISDIDVPSFDKSPLDGYAFKREDVEFASKEKPVELKVVAVIMAGDVYDRILLNGQAVRLMTGAKVPNGANCIIRYEDTEFNDEKVKIFSPMGKNYNIIKAGEDIKKGEIIIPKNTVITPSEIGVLASLGILNIQVYKQPCVSVFATGSELLDVNEKIEDGKIRNSNSYTIEQLCKTYGANAIQLGKVEDDLDTLIIKFSESLEKSKIVISTGGISVGDSDFILTALDKLGVETVFTRVNAKPGGHVFFGKKDNKYVFALSGNPAAAFMNFYLYVRPLILKLQGKEPFMLKVLSELKNGFNKATKGYRILRASTVYENGKYYTELESKQNSGVLSTMVLKNSIVIVKPNEVLNEGDLVETEFLYNG